MLQSQQRKRKTQKKVRNLSDFYTANNKDWMEATALPDTESRITQTYFIQKKINKELSAIIKTQDGPMADLRASWIATEGRGVPDGLSSLFQIMMTTNSISDICARIGWMNRNGISAPLSIYIEGDPRDHKRCRVFIDEGSPRIGIPEYWLEERYVGHRRAYEIYVRDLAAIMGLPPILLGYTAEREFAHVFPSVGSKTKINMLTWHELVMEYRTIDWVALFTAWGLHRDQLPDLVFNVSSAAFLHHIQNRMLSWSMLRWQGWFSLLVAQWIAGITPKSPLRSAWFAYNRTFLQGAKVDVTTEDLRDDIISSLMPNTLGKLWIAKHDPPAVRKGVTTMVRYIQAAGVAKLRTVGWMAPTTRAAAIRKLRNMRIEVCSPAMDKWKPKEEACSLSRTNFVENLMTLSKLGTDWNLEMLKKGDCRRPSGDNWSRPVFTVNAYYYPDENKFLLPAAILRPPFYEPGRSLVWNYGATGTTIGHEFCHAFDSDGRTYDEHGDKRDWWSKRNAAEYKKRAHHVQKFYDAATYRGMPVDGELTLVENIADIGGLEIALAGLRSALGRALTKAEMQDFFTSFAISWQSKDRYKRAAQLLVTDPHSPPMLRVNQVVRQFDEWYEAFDQRPDNCKDFIPPEKRIRFFA